MLCPTCGYYAEGEEIVCPECGQILQSDRGRKLGGAQAIRQGKRAREAALRRPEKPAEDLLRKRRSGASHATVEMPEVKESAAEEEPEIGTVTEREALEDRGEEGFERRRRSVYDDQQLNQERAEADALQYTRRRGDRIHLVNWMKVTLVTAAIAVLALGGGWVFLKRTDMGQKILVRLGRDATSTALWAVGDELMNEGDIEGAIAAFEKAKAQDEAEGTVDVDGLLLLGNAYEADGRIDDAATLYEQIYTETPSRVEAYVNHIRILRNRMKPGDLAKAGELMKLAYDMTGDSSFATQRSDLLPAPPEVDLTAGYYESKKYIAITSYQGYDVYYTFDENAELPAGGTLFTERVFLDEGIHSLRAVAVNGELVSDELRGTYRIIMPSPMTPRSNLAPNTYRTRQRVKLKPGKDNENDDDIVIYYTIDGSSPDADSPIFNGEAIVLPAGWVTLKAVAVNKYGKVSNTLEVKYKIDVKPVPLTGFDPEKDTFSGLKLNQTTMAEFTEKYGEGTLEEEFSREGFTTACRKYTYPWGYAVMNLKSRTWVLVEVYVEKSGFLTGPRNTNVGDPMDYIVGRFRDMGQVASASGNRGLYATETTSGKIWLQEDGNSDIRYRYKSAAGWVQLDYWTRPNGITRAIQLQLIP